MAWTTNRGALALALAIGTAVAAGGALAHDDDPTPTGNLRPAVRAAYARHEHFEQLGKTFKQLSDELKKDSPDPRVVKSAAATVNTLATGLPTWFPRGRGREARPKSEAKPAIWTDAAAFQAAAANLQVQASKLNQVAMGGDMGAVKAQFRSTGAACKACHDKFRQEKS